VVHGEERQPAAATPSAGDGSGTVFCDFDGTITEADTLQAVVQHFLPASAGEVLADIGRGTISLRTGIERLIGALPSARADDIREFVNRQPLRAGFETFLLRMRERNMPVVVISSGMRFCVEARLAPWRHLLHRIYALDVALDQPRMRARIVDGNALEAVPKADILLRYPVRPRIVIGDSLSDQSMALQADITFARDRLLTFLHRRGSPAIAYRDFHDILRAFPSTGIA
jgi:2-hydroxy-3-keto-5-methylthiopentenyl-1-phosphate phosphatase